MSDGWSEQEIARVESQRAEAELKAADAAPVEANPDDPEVLTRRETLIRRADPEWREGDPTWHLEFVTTGNSLSNVRLVGDLAVVRQQRAQQELNNRRDYGPAPENAVTEEEKVR